MSNNADVRSLVGLETFLDKLAHFRTQLLKELDLLVVESRRLTGWLANDAHGYWSDELTKAQRVYVDAQQSLSRCMSYVRADEQRPCTEEKKRMLKAELRRELCELKLREVHTAINQWEREQAKNRGKIERCRDMADADLLVAIHHLRGQIERLETYANLRSSAASSKDPGPSATRDGHSSAPPEPDQNP